MGENEYIDLIINDLKRVSGQEIDDKQRESIAQIYREDPNQIIDFIARKVREKDPNKRYVDISERESLRRAYGIPSDFKGKVAGWETGGKNIKSTETNANGYYQIVPKYHAEKVKEITGKNFDEFIADPESQDKYMDYLEGTYKKRLPEYRALPNMDNYTDEEIMAAQHVLGPTGAKNYFLNGKAKNKRADRDINNALEKLNSYNTNYGDLNKIQPDPKVSTNPITPTWKSDPNQKPTQAAPDDYYDIINEQLKKQKAAVDKAVAGLVKGAPNDADLNLAYNLIDKTNSALNTANDYYDSFFDNYVSNRQKEFESTEDYINIQKKHNEPLLAKQNELATNVMETPEYKSLYNALQMQVSYKTRTPESAEEELNNFLNKSILENKEYLDLKSFSDNSLNQEYNSVFNEVLKNDPEYQGNFLKYNNLLTSHNDAVNSLNSAVKSYNKKIKNSKNQPSEIDAMSYMSDVSKKAFSHKGRVNRGGALIRHTVGELREAKLMADSKYQEALKWHLFKYPAMVNPLISKSVEVFSGLIEGGLSLLPDKYNPISDQLKQNAKIIKEKEAAVIKELAEAQNAGKIVVRPVSLEEVSNNVRISDSTASPKRVASLATSKLSQNEDTIRDIYLYNKSKLSKEEQALMSSIENGDNVDASLITPAMKPAIESLKQLSDQFKETRKVVKKYNYIGNLIADVVATAKDDKKSDDEIRDKIFDIIERSTFSDGEKAAMKNSINDITILSSESDWTRAILKTSRSMNGFVDAVWDNIKEASYGGKFASQKDVEDEALLSAAVGLFDKAADAMTIKGGTKEQGPAYETIVIHKSGKRFVLGPDKKIIGIRGEDERFIPIIENSPEEELADAYNAGETGEFTEKSNFRGNAFIESAVSTLSDVAVAMGVTYGTGGGALTFAGVNSSIYFDSYYKQNLEQHPTKSLGEVFATSLLQSTAVSSLDLLFGPESKLIKSIGNIGKSTIAKAATKEIAQEVLEKGAKNFVKNGGVTKVLKEKTVDFLKENAKNVLEEWGEELTFEPLAENIIYSTIFGNEWKRNSFEDNINTFLITGAITPIIGGFSSVPQFFKGAENRDEILSFLYKNPEKIEEIYKSVFENAKTETEKGELMDNYAKAKKLIKTFGWVKESVIDVKDNLTENSISFLNDIGDDIVDLRNKANTVKSEKTMKALEEKIAEKEKVFDSLVGMSIAGNTATTSIKENTVVHHEGDFYRVSFNKEDSGVTLKPLFGKQQGEDVKLNSIDDINPNISKEKIVKNADEKRGSEEVPMGERTTDSEEVREGDSEGKKVTGEGKEQAEEKKIRAYDFDDTLYDTKKRKLTPLGEEVKRRIAAGEDITILTARNSRRTKQIENNLGISKDKIRATGDEGAKADALREMGISPQEYFDADKGKLDAIQKASPSVKVSADQEKTSYTLTYPSGKTTPAIVKDGRWFLPQVGELNPDGTYKGAFAPEVHEKQLNEKYGTADKVAASKPVAKEAGRKTKEQAPDTVTKVASTGLGRGDVEGNQHTAGYSTIALDYLFTGGRDVIQSTDYLLQALVGGFEHSAKEIDAIRNKYADKLGNIKDDINSEVYKSMMQEIKDVINKKYNDVKAGEIFDKILNNATGFTNREGNQVSIELEKLNEDQSLSPNKEQAPDTVTKPQATMDGKGVEVQYIIPPAATKTETPKQDKAKEKGTETPPIKTELENIGKTAKQIQGQIYKFFTSRIPGLPEDKARELAVSTYVMWDSIGRTLGGAKGIDFIQKKLAQIGQISTAKEAIKMAKDAKGKVKFQDAQEYYIRNADRLPLTLAVFNRPEFKELIGKVVNPITILNKLNQTGIKAVEKDLIKGIIEENFKGENKIKYDELEAVVRANLMPLERIFISSYADYGMKSLSGDYGNATTIILNAPIEHGVTGHFSGAFKASGRKNIKYVPKQLDANTWAAVEEGYESQANENNIYQFVGTAGTKDAVDAWIENYNNEGSLDNINDSVNKGMFGHIRVWQDGEVFNVAELQSDYFQKQYVVEDMTQQVVNSDKYNFTAEQKAEYNAIFIDMVKYRNEYFNERDRVKVFDTLSKETKENLEVLKKNYEEKKAQYEKKVVSKARPLFEKDQKQFIASQKSWEQRMVREAIKEAALSGATKLRFPTPYTLSVIEGYINPFKEDTDAYLPYEIESAQNNNELIPGDSINYLDTRYIVLETTDYGDMAVINSYSLYSMGNNKFFTEAQAKNTFNINLKDGRQVFEGKVFFKEEDKVFIFNEEDSSTIETLQQPYIYKDNTGIEKENFSINKYLSETQQTVAYKYEEIAKILKKERGKDKVEVVTDENGFDWYETQVTPEDLSKPVVAFQQDSTDPSLIEQASRDIVNNAITHLDELISKGKERLRAEKDTAKRKDLQKSIVSLQDTQNRLKKSLKDPKFSSDKKFRAAAIDLGNSTFILAALQDPTITSPSHEFFHSTIEGVMTPEEKQAFIDEYNQEFGDKAKSWTTDVSEYTARTYEKYLTNGRKLTAAEVKDTERRKKLQKAFDNFTEWAKNLYNSVIEYNNTKGVTKPINLTPQAQAFFDRVTGIQSQPAPVKAESVKEVDKEPETENPEIKKLNNSISELTKRLKTTVSPSQRYNIQNELIRLQTKLKIMQVVSGSEIEAISQEEGVDSGSVLGIIFDKFSEAVKKGTLWVISPIKSALNSVLNKLKWIAVVSMAAGGVYLYNSNTTKPNAKIEEIIISADSTSKQEAVKNFVYDTPEVIKNNVVETASILIGQTEIGKNKGFTNPKFQDLMEDAGWVKWSAWCSFFTKAVYSNTKGMPYEMIDDFDRVLSGSSKGSFANIKKGSSKFLKVTDEPSLGGLVYFDAKNRPGGHVGIVANIYSDGTLDIIEGNTNGRVTVVKRNPKQDPDFNFLGFASFDDAAVNDVLQKYPMEPDDKSSSPDPTQQSMPFFPIFPIRRKRKDGDGEITETDSIANSIPNLTSDQKKSLKTVIQNVSKNIANRLGISLNEYNKRIRTFKANVDLNKPVIEGFWAKNFSEFSTLPQVLFQPNNDHANKRATHPSIKKLNLEESSENDWLIKYLLDGKLGADLQKLTTKEDIDRKLLEYFETLGEKIKSSDEFVVSDLPNEFIDEQIKKLDPENTGVSLDQEALEQWKEIKKDKNILKQKAEEQRSVFLDNYTYLKTNQYPLGLKVLLLENLLYTNPTFNEQTEEFKKGKRDNKTLSVPILINGLSVSELQKNGAKSSQNVLNDYLWGEKNFKGEKVNFNEYKDNVFQKTENGVWFKFSGEKDLDRFKRMSALSATTMGRWCTGSDTMAKSYLVDRKSDMYIFYNTKHNNNVSVQVAVANGEVFEIGGTLGGQDMTEQADKDFSKFIEDNNNNIKAGKLQNYILYKKAIQKLQKNNWDITALTNDELENIYKGKKYYKDKTDLLDRAKKSLPIEFYESYYKVDREFIFIGNTSSSYLSPKIKIVTGNLDINSNATLNALTTIGGNLNIDSNATLNADALTTVGGRLYINSNATLNALTTIGGNLNIDSNATLNADALTTVGGNLNIYSNSTLNALTTVGGNLNINSKSTLNALTTVGGYLNIDSNATLNALTTVGGYLNIDSNATLNADALTTVGGNLNINSKSTLNADALTTIGGNLNIHSTATFIVKGKRINKKEDLIELNKKVLNQGGKAAVIKTKDKTFFIFGKSSNLTSAIHEKAHEYEDVLTSEEIKKLEDWSGYKIGSTEFSESFAKGAERFIYEGYLADDKKLGGIFKKFVEWFKNYIQDAIEYFKDINNLNDGVKEIYARMLLEERANTDASSVNFSRGVRTDDNKTSLELLGKTKSQIVNQIKKFFTDTVKGISEEQSTRLAEANFIMWESIAKTLAKKDGPQAAINFMRSKLARIGIISTAEVASGMGVAKFAEDTNDALKDVESTAKALEGINTFDQQDSKAEVIVGKEKDRWGRSQVWRERIENAGDILRELSSRGKNPDVKYLQEKIDKIKDWILRGSGFGELPENIKTLKDVDESNIRFSSIVDGKEYLDKFHKDVLQETIDAYKGIVVKTQEEQVVKDFILTLLQGDKSSIYSKLREVEDIVRKVKKQGELKSTPLNVSEAYHKAKADGSNPELVKAVEQSIKETPQSGGGVKLSSSNTLQKSVSMVLNAPIEYMKMIINSEVAAERKETDKTKKSQLRKSIQENKKVLAHLIAARKDPKFSKDAEVYRGVAIALANGQHIVAALESPVPTTFAHEAIFHSTIEPFLETDLEAKQAFIDEYNEVFEANESEWSTDVSEYTARVYEKYLSNGRKLTEADVKDKGRRATLQKAFDAFTEMMKNLYQSVISYKGKEIQLSDQARMFFDKVHGLNTQSVAETIVESSMSPVHKNIFDLMTNKKSSADITSEEVFDIFRYAKNAGIYLGENNKLTKKCN